MTKDRPIGLFDSGLGGTSIWKEINSLLPLEQTIYLADSAHAPYGEKTTAEILRLSIKNTEKLLEMGAKIIVVACNTATTNAIQQLRSTYSVPFVGIEPAIKPAALQTTTRSIGILATRGTLSSALFAKTSELYSRDIRVTEVVGTGLVEQIEKGQKDSEDVQKMLQEMLRPMIDAKIDYLVLGCSHYPYLIPVLKRILPPNVSIIDSGMAVARQTKLVLQSMDLLATNQQKSPLFLTNGDASILRRILKDHSGSSTIAHVDF